MVYLDGKPLPAAAGLTLEEILRLAGRDPALTAVTADGRFVQRSDYGKLRPREGCRLRVFELHDGG